MGTTGCRYGTQRVSAKIFHLISMGDVAAVMRDVIEAVAAWDPRRLAFHTQRQAADFQLPAPANVVGNGFDLSNYTFQSQTNGPLGWAGRIAPEKGLEDAAAAAAALGEQLLVWGLREDDAYARQVESSVPKGTIDWRGFRSTQELQQELGPCRALINTPKWNEAYGNVVAEALACGVPVVAYDRGGPGELVNSGRTGWLVPPDDVAALAEALRCVDSIERSYAAAGLRSMPPVRSSVSVLNRGFEKDCRRMSASPPGAEGPLSVNVSGRQRRQVLALVLTLGLVITLWRLGSTGVVDETPPLFAAAGRAMADTGDWLTPRVNGLPVTTNRLWCTG